MADVELPDFHDPPVVEIVAAAQFAPLPRFGMPEIVAVARAFDDRQIIDAPPALDPIVEPPPGTIGPQGFRLSLGSPPQQLVPESDVGRWVAQMQHDRLAVHERWAAGRLRSRTSTRSSLRSPTAPQGRSDQSAVPAATPKTPIATGFSSFRSVGAWRLIGPRTGPRGPLGPGVRELASPMTADAFGVILELERTRCPP